MASAKLNITLEEGGSFQKQILWTDSSNSPVSLLYWWARIGFVDDYSTTASAQSIFLEADQENDYGSKLTIDESGGTIDIFISVTDIEQAMTAGFKRGFWDLEIIPPKTGTVNVYSGAYTNADFDAIEAGTGFARIEADNPASNYTANFAVDDYVILRGLADSRNDGIYKVGAVTATVLDMTTQGYNAADSATNASLKMWVIDESKAVRLIGGKVNVNESATPRKSVRFEST